VNLVVLIDLCFFRFSLSLSLSLSLACLLVRCMRFTALCIAFIFKVFLSPCTTVKRRLLLALFRECQRNQLFFLSRNFGETDHKIILKNCSLGSNQKLCSPYFRFPFKENLIDSTNN
jgi:hypothetical protein